MAPEEKVGEEGARAARNRMREEFLFGEGGLADQYPEIRKELYFLLDDGWDVPFDVHPDRQITRFGSLILAEDRFPSFSGSPAERLKKLNRALQERGWKGAALWVAAHGVGEDPEKGVMSRKEAERYWGERMRWCCEAGIEYWKIDWGFHQFDPAWKEMITSLRDRLAPSLHVEHSFPAACPLNHVTLQAGVQVSDGRFAGWEDYPARWGEALRCSEIFRTYDVLQKFAPVSTLDRMVTLMTENEQADTILNCEDEPYLGAVLGCSLGIMRSGLCEEIPGFCFDPRQTRRRLDEVTRAVNWQKLAPPFSIREGALKTGGELIRETGRLHRGEFWEAEYLEREIFQQCHGIVVRNRELPEILYEETVHPIVAAAEHPNGAVSVLTLARQDGAGGWRTPGAGIVLKGIRRKTPVGVFGHWSRVILTVAEGEKPLRVLAADLRDGNRRDITAGCRIVGNQIEIGREVFEKIGENREGDLSEPGIVLFLR